MLRWSGAAGALTGMIVSAAAEAGAVRYVDDGALPGGDGTGWSSAYQFLQDALAEAAEPGSGVTEIRLGQGVYRPDRDAGSPGGTGDRGATFQLLSGVAVRGGYAGLGAPDPDERDIARFVAVLSGDLGADDGPGFTGNDENAYHVVTGSGADGTALLEGVTVTAGNADGAAPDDRGAGVRNVTGSPTVAICTITASQALAGGGGMLNQNSGPTVTGCAFSFNDTGAGDGGGMLNQGGSPQITDCTFSANTGENGAGMANIHADATVTGCVFTANEGILGAGMHNDTCAPIVTGCTFTANDGGFGGGMYNRMADVQVVSCTFSGNGDFAGGGMFNTSESRPVISGCQFIGNVVSTNGGAVVNAGLSNPVFTGCQFLGNAAEFGGAVLTNTALSLFDGCTFGGPLPGDGNSATATGGAMYCLFGTPTVSNCLFQGNTADFAGGLFADQSDPAMTACEFRGNVGGLGEGAVGNFENSNPAITDCLFVDNSGVFGGALRNFDQCSPTVTRCTFLTNSASNAGGAVVNFGGSEPRFEACRFLGNSAAQFGGAMRSDTGCAPVLVNCLMAANTAGFAGGGIQDVSGSASTLISCTFTGNDGGLAGGGLMGASSSVAGCILWDNEPGEIEGTAAVSYSLVEGGFAGPGNLDEDPLFIDAGGGDYGLAAGSPCIDAADNVALPADVLTDLDGGPRRLDDRAVPDRGLGECPIVDMGALERAGGTPDCCPWDLDGDTTAGIGDLLALLAAWGSAPGGPPDFDGSGTVDIGDLLELLANWGPCE